MFAGVNVSFHLDKNKFVCSDSVERFVCMDPVENFLFASLAPSMRFRVTDWLTTSYLGQTVIKIQPGHTSTEKYNIKAS